MAEITYSVPGMSCAHCEHAVSSELREVTGVETATVHCDPTLPAEQLVAAVASAGYGARVAHEVHDHHHEPLAALTRRLVLAIVLTVPVALLAMVPPLRFTGWEWLALALSTPVVY